MIPPGYVRPELHMTSLMVKMMKPHIPLYPMSQKTTIIAQPPLVPVCQKELEEVLFPPGSQSRLSKTTART